MDDLFFIFKMPPSTDVVSLTAAVSSLLAVYRVNQANKLDVPAEFDLSQFQHPIPESQEFLIAQFMELKDQLTQLSNNSKEVELLSAKVAGQDLILKFGYVDVINHVHLSQRVQWD